MSTESETKHVQSAIDTSVANRTLLSYDDAKAYLRLAHLGLKSKEDYQRWFKANESNVGKFLPENPEDYYSNHK
jgi:hypothetical protein